MTNKIKEKKQLGLFLPSLKMLNKFHNWYSLSLIFILLILYREYNLFVEPRFWAEEATVYFKNAYEANGLSNFFTPRLGYYSLFNQISVYLSLQVSLANAPFVTTFLSILPIFCVFYVCIETKNKFIKTDVQRLIFGVLLILISSGEIWLNTITSQFWLAVTVLMLLLDQQEWNGKKKYFYFFCVVLGSLTGVMTLFLLPLAIILKFKIKNKQKNNINLIIFLILTGLFIQITLLMIFGFNLGQQELAKMQGGERFISFSFVQIVKSYLGYYILYPFTGFLIFDYSFKFYLMQAVLIFIALSYLFLSDFKSNFIYLLFANLITFLTIFLSVGGTGGLRYAYLINVIYLLLVFKSFNSEKKFKSLLARILILVTLVISLVEYKYKINDFYNADWISWKSQVNAEHSDVLKLKVWPQFPYSWELILQKKSYD